MSTPEHRTGRPSPRRPPQPIRFLRRRGPAALALAVLAAALTACTAPRPGVTFFSGRQSVQAEPTAWCDVDYTALTYNCDNSENRPQNAATLPLRPGASVEVDVDGDLAASPWWVFYAYTDAAGATQSLRTAQFTDKTLSTTIRVPDANDRLLRVEVQSGFLPQQNGIVATRSWVLTPSS